ncbi:MAG: TonB-dependent receptor [Flavobacteriaceae bacterium]|nr:TonB-dependent receptor [Flavobacteriaceae bacterium]
MNKFITVVFLLLLSTTMWSQTVITGNVTDAKTGEPIPGASIKVVGKALGTSTDFDGNYSLKLSENPPFSIEISNLGYASQTFEITESEQTVNAALTEAENSLDEVVVSASRTPESIRESPVTIERMGVKQIKNTTTANFYEGLQNMKGVDVNTGSLTFNSVNTRGFATFANTRFVQLIDGMDNSSPALNFVMGNLIGINELDLQSIELIPGASSALYGANAFNGILFMTSKSPFDYTGISAYAKTGITTQEVAGDHNFYDLGIRAAYKFTDHFAAKISFSYMEGTDWYAYDTNQYVESKVGEPDYIIPYDPSALVHDGLNIYGDEVTLAASGTDLHGVAQALEAQGLIPSGASSLVPAVNVGRTGYREQDLTDYDAKSAKFDGSLVFRPFADDLEIIWNSRVGFGSTIYQGANRYQLKDFLLQQHKLEIRNEDFFLRGYTTSEVAGKSYDMRFTGINMNKVNATEWFGTYAGAYLQSVLAGASDAQAHATARQTADAAYTPQPGTPQFEALFNQVTSDPDISTGSKFLDNTKMYVAEGNYNFSRLLDHAADILIGGSYRQYSLNSFGTIFTDYDGPIKYNEYGAYIQASKKFADDRLKLTGSIRYDKNEFFDGNYSPRLSAVYSAGANKNHNFRISYQTGFRNPDTQSLFIGFDVGRAILVGSSPKNLDRNLPGTSLTGRDVYYDSYSRSSVEAFAASGNPALLERASTPLVQPEKVTAYDFGYRGNVGKVFFDMNVYYNKYDGFMNQKIVITPNSGSVGDASGIADIVTGNYQAFQTYTNSTADVASYGAIIGVDTKIAGFDIGLNYTYSKLDFDQAKEPDFSAGFNTPRNYFKATLGNDNLFKNFGFNVNFRWSDKYLWQSSIANAIVPERKVLDAQINYSVPKIKSTFKIGGSNLTGEEYQSAVGTGWIGSQYYISWVIND